MFVVHHTTRNASTDAFATAGDIETVKCPNCNKHFFSKRFERHYQAYTRTPRQANVYDRRRARIKHSGNSPYFDLQTAEYFMNTSYSSEWYGKLVINGNFL